MTQQQRDVLKLAMSLTVLIALSGAAWFTVIRTPPWACLTHPDPGACLVTGEHLASFYAVRELRASPTRDARLLERMMDLCDRMRPTGKKAECYGMVVDHFASMGKASLSRACERLRPATAPDHPVYERLCSR